MAKARELCQMSLSGGMQQSYFHDPQTRLPHMDLIFSILCDITLGMAYIHSKNIIHGDLKPENVLLKLEPSHRHGIVGKITDFGMSTTIRPDQSHISNFRMGTPFYIAPEVLLSHQTTQASDVFSFGVLLQQILSGQTPWLAERNPQAPQPAQADIRQPPPHLAQQAQPGGAQPTSQLDQQTECDSLRPYSHLAQQDQPSSCTQTSTNASQRTSSAEAIVPGTSCSQYDVSYCQQAASSSTEPQTSGSRPLQVPYCQHEASSSTEPQTLGPRPAQALCKQAKASMAFNIANSIYSDPNSSSVSNPNFPGEEGGEAADRYDGLPSSSQPQSEEGGAAADRSDGLPSSSQPQEQTPRQQAAPPVKNFNRAVRANPDFWAVPGSVFIPFQLIELRNRCLDKNFRNRPSFKDAHGVVNALYNILMSKAIDGYVPAPPPGPVPGPPHTPSGLDQAAAAAAPPPIFLSHPSPRPSRAGVEAPGGLAPLSEAGERAWSTAF
eukprot:gene26216-11948_t